MGARCRSRLLCFSFLQIVILWGSSISWMQSTSNLCTQLFRQRLSHNSTKAHAAMQIGYYGQKQFSATWLRFMVFSQKERDCMNTRVVRQPFSKQLQSTLSRLLLRVEDTADVQQQRTKGQKNEENNRDNRFVQRRSFVQCTVSSTRSKSR